ncbi:hypothetical protein ACFL96_13855 [Thermoproteota archaeon]
MGRKRDRKEAERLSPTETLDNVTDNFLETELHIPELSSVPERLEQSIKSRTEQCLHYLKWMNSQDYATPYEVRLIVETRDMISTAKMLGINDADRYYAQFKNLVEDLGYERIDRGFKKKK